MFLYMSQDGIPHSGRTAGLPQSAPPAGAGSPAAGQSFADMFSTQALQARTEGQGRSIADRKAQGEVEISDAQGADLPQGDPVADGAADSDLAVSPEGGTELEGRIDEHFGLGLALTEAKALVRNGRDSSDTSFSGPPSSTLRVISDGSANAPRWPAAPFAATDVPPGSAVSSVGVGPVGPVSSAPESRAQIGLPLDAAVARQADLARVSAAYAGMSALSKGLEQAGVILPGDGRTGVLGKAEVVPVAGQTRGLPLPAMNGLSQLTPMGGPTEASSAVQKNTETAPLAPRSVVTAMQSDGSPARAGGRQPEVGQGPVAQTAPSTGGQVQATAGVAISPLEWRILSGASNPLLAGRSIEGPADLAVPAVASRGSETLPAATVSVRSIAQPVGAANPSGALTTDAMSSRSVGAEMQDPLKPTLVEAPVVATGASGASAPLLSVAQVTVQRQALAAGGFEDGWKTIRRPGYRFDGR
jgi:hypothetical protein